MGQSASGQRLLFAMSPTDELSFVGELERVGGDVGASSRRPPVFHASAFISRTVPDPEQRDRGTHQGTP
jgi:hypothetical protein